MTRKQRILVFSIAGFMAVAVMAMIAYIVVRGVRGAIPKEARGEDRKLVVTAAALQTFGAPAPDPKRERLTIQKSFDGSFTIDYSYSNESGGVDGSRIFLSSQAFVFFTKLSAIQMFKMQQIGLKSGFAMTGDIKVVPEPSLITSGDDHYSAILESKASGQKLGNLFLVRQGRSLLSVVIVGMSFNDADSVERLLKPALDEGKRRFVKR